MSLTTNHFDRGKPFYPIVVNYVSQLVGFKELIVRGLSGPRKLDEAVVQALELLGVSYASPPERNLIGEQLNKLMGPLELRSECMGNHITVDIDWIAREFVDNWSYLLNHTMLAAASVVVLAHEGAKGKPWLDQGPLWEFLRHCRHAASHGGRFNFVNGEPRRPAHWGSLHITASLQGTPLFKGSDGTGFLGPGDPIRLLWDLEQAYPGMSL